MRSLMFFGGIALGFLVALVIAIAWPSIFDRVVPMSAAQRQSISIGEMYDVLTAIITFFAFVGVVVTLLMQRQDLKNQREDAAAQRRDAELAAVRSEFFQLLDAWQDIVRVTRYGERDGRPAFAAMAHDLATQLDQFRARTGGTFTSLDAAADFFDAFYRQAISEPLGHYFRLSYNIVKLVHDSDLSSHDKRNLIRLIRAHLSEPELNLLFWFGLSRYGQKFRMLIDEYDMLQSFMYSGVQPDERAFYPKTSKRDPHR